ncbi:unnamed protein product [Gordionus sp. m RMFG-2023]|uniref:dynactin subunit 2-A-like n=1 Tax=Gordionus sp. m RMFG-2023 TaxID=3053472 RepID=UPI0030E578C3
MDNEIKFSLPGMAFDEPDIYESPSPKNLEKDIENNDIDVNTASENINSYHLDPDQAFNKFKDKRVTISHYSNFSEDDISNKFKRANIPKGYMTIEYDPEKLLQESPLEKYERIQRDLTDLQTQLQQLQLDQQNDPKIGIDQLYSNIKPEILMANLEETNEKIKKLQYGSIMSGSTVDKDITNMMEAILAGDKTVLNSINHFEATLKGDEKNKPDKNEVTFELFCNPELLQKSTTEESSSQTEEFKSRVSELTQRLNRLETIVGDRRSLNDKLSCFSEYSTNQIESTSITDIVSALNFKLSMLERLVNTSERNTIENYCKDLMIQYSQLFPNNNPSSSSKPDGNPRQENVTGDQNNGKINALSPEEKDKINKLYDAIKSCEAVCTDLPSICQRLTDLNGVYRKGVEFEELYEELVANQDSIQKTLKQNADIFQKVKEEFKDNTKIIQENCSQLEKRILALK